MSNSRPNCASLANPSYANFGVSLFILVGILVSYLPQHYRIISRRTSEGISPYFVLLGTTSGTCAFANILTLPTSRADLRCCSEVSGFECFAGLLGIAQVGVQWSCFAVILLLFLIFFPRATPLIPPNSSSSPPPSYRTAVFITLTCVLHAVVTLIVSALILYLAPQHLQSWANALGILATLLAAVQFIPQLFTTWQLQAAGSLSIPTMCIQTPGSFVFAASLAKRLGTAGWSLWGIYLVTGCLQGSVLGMCIYFELRERRRKKGRKESENDDGGGGGEHEREQNGHVRAVDDEDTALLGNER
ncbi:hypothetical protein MMC07_003387 [Pseudocyphellaria aurata]|nr:hypothetical protein [Pseudocyphellaria aurata]